MRLFKSSLFATLFLCASTAAAEEIDQPNAVQTAVENNPSLYATMLDLRASEHAVAAEEDRYPLLMQLDAGVTHLRNPSLTGTDDVLTSTTDSVVLGSELKKTFAWGTSFNFRLEGYWSRASTPIFSGSDQEVTLGPGYGVSARLTVVQPLIRGFGSDVGEAELRQAKVTRDAATAAKDRAASELLRDVLTAYWELWYTSEAHRIEVEARDLARNERDDTQARIDGGALAPVRIHEFTTRVAELDEAVMVADLERRRRAIELGNHLGKPGRASANLVAGKDGPAPTAAPDANAVVQSALDSSPELREVETTIARAREAERIAGEPDRHRLDLEGWVQTEGLGNRRVPPAFEQFGTFGAVSAHLGLVWEFPLTGSRQSSQQARAKVDTQAAIERREALRNTIRTNATLLIDRVRASTERATLASRTKSIAEKQVAAAKDRVEEGDGLVIEIQRAEDSVRRAQLREAPRPRRRRHRTASGRPPPGRSPDTPRRRPRRPRTTARSPPRRHAEEPRPVLVW